MTPLLQANETKMLHIICGQHLASTKNERILTVAMILNNISLDNWPERRIPSKESRRRRGRGERSG